MKKTTFLITTLLIVAIALSCKRSPSSKPDKIKVATSIFPVYDIIRNLAKGHLEVFFIVPVGANPHTYSPEPSTITKLQEADIFIGIHPALDGWAGNFLMEQTKIIYLYKQFSNKGNPHIWLTLKGAKKIAEKITDSLCRIDTLNSADYKNNLTAYIQELEKLDLTISSLFKKSKTKKFIQWHPAWNYMAEDYGLEIAGTIQRGHGDSPSVKAFKNMIDTAKQKNVRVIVIGLKEQTKEPEALANEIGGFLVRMDSIGDPVSAEKSSYTKLMHYNAKVLSEALNK